MTDPQPGRNPVEELAEAFLERYRRGERPSLSEYTRPHPELADEIRELFPALVMMEEAGPREVDRGGPGGGRVTADGQELRRLGDYRILRQVGRGGMGVVYEAEQEALGRHVALKVLPFESAADPIRLERFRREARAVARLHHTNIVPVFDVGVQEGIHYYAMQFIQGQGLDEVLAEVKRLRASKAGAPEAGPRLAGDLASGLLTGQFKAEPFQEACGDLEPREDSDGAGASNPRANDSGLPRPADSAISTSDVFTSRSDLSTQSDFPYYQSVARVGLQAAEALAYAHGQRVLHRDIKPSNLLLDLQGIIWVTDFGLAKDEGSDLTRTGDVVGTVRYMAPERFTGISDPRSDIYSLGLTLYELLTLRPAFQESDRPRLIWRVSHEEPPSPRKVDRRLPRDLETIVLKAIAKEQGRRYQTAAEMAEDLRRFLTDRPIRARRSSWPELAWRWGRRNPGWAAMVGSVITLLLIIALVLSVGLVRLQTALDRVETAESLAQEKLYNSLVQQALATSRSRRPGQRIESLARVAEATRLARERGWLPEKAPELRNAALAALAMTDLYPGQSWACPSTGETYVDFDETLTTYARTDRQGNCSIRRVANDQEVHFLTNPDAPPRQGFGPISILSADGRFVVVFYQKGTAYLWQIDGDQPKLLRTEKEVWCAYYHPDSTQVAFAHADGAISLYSLVTGQALQGFPRDLSPQAPWRELLLAFHPTKPLLAVGSYFATEVQIRNLKTGRSERKLDRPSGCSWVAWHPRGQLLAVTDGDSVGIHLYDGSSFQLLRTLSGAAGGTRVHFNHAGDRLLASSWDSSLLLFDVPAGQLLFQHPPVTHTIQLRFNRYDDRLAGGTGFSQINLWQVADGREYRTLALPPRRGDLTYGPAAVHPRGRLLAASVNLGGHSLRGVGFWDLDTGDCLAYLPEVGIYDVCFEAEPSGALLTIGLFGAFRWPVRIDPDEPGRASTGVVIGPPTRLPLPPGQSLSRSRDGQVLASAARAITGFQRYAGGWVVHTNRPGSAQRLEAKSDMDSVVVAPDGRWVAALRHDGVLRLWDAANGQLIRQLRDWHFPQFSPDDRLLAANGRVYAVGSWEEVGPSFRGWGVFAPDSKRLAVMELDHNIRLLETESGQEVARLQDPNLETPNGVSFTPDGTRLITVTNGKERGIHVWDLSALRARLKEMKLDWNAPDYRPAPREAVPLRLEILGAQGFAPAARALDHLDNQQPEAAAAELEKALVLLPQLDWACNQLARLHLLGPKSLRNPDKAVALAERAIQLCPNDFTYKSTLGMACYRAGRFQAARDALEASLRDSLGWQEAYDLFFLAMCHHRLGEQALANDCYNRAIRWGDERQGRLPSDWAAELHELRQEAGALLGLCH
jgi:serine/threonine protein kinase/WD40 repeat protein